MSVSYPRVSSAVSEWRYTFQSVINTPCKRLGDTGPVPPSRFRAFRFRAVTTAVETMRPTSPCSPPRLRSTVQTLAFVPTLRREPSDRTKKNPPPPPPPLLRLRPKQYFYLWKFVGDDLSETVAAAGGRRLIRFHAERGHLLFKLAPAVTPQLHRRSCNKVLNDETKKRDRLISSLTR